jgi:CheY-like chemotaxis protein
MPRRRHGPLLVWLIDDTAEHHATARATLADMRGVAFAGYIDAGEAIETFSRLAADEPALLPRVVLMDFYLGDWRGDTATRELRRLQPGPAPLTIVGYSSVASGSERILAAGGDLVVRKARDDSGRNHYLARWLDEFIRELPKAERG